MQLRTRYSHTRSAFALWYKITLSCKSYGRTQLYLFITLGEESRLSCRRAITLGCEDDITKIQRLDPGALLGGFDIDTISSSFC